MKNQFIIKFGYYFSLILFIAGIISLFLFWSIILIPLSLLMFSVTILLIISVPIIKSPNNGKDFTDKSSIEMIRKLSTAVEASPASIIITDKEGIIEYVNPYCCELTGYLSEELIGSKPSFLKSELNPPEIYDDLWNKITNGKKWFGEFSNKKKSGELYWESASISPIFDKKGNITHYVAIKNDITEDKKIKQTLKYERNRLRTLIDNIPDLIYAKDVEARKMLANKADVKLMGISSEEECLGKTDSVFYPEVEAKEYISEDLRVINSGKPSLNSEGWKTYESGIRRFYNTNKYPLRDETGRIIGLVGIGRDVTDIKLKELELQKLLQIQSKLVTMFKSNPSDITQLLKDIVKIAMDITDSKLGFTLVNKKNNKYSLAAYKNRSLDDHSSLDFKTISQIANDEIWSKLANNGEHLVINNFYEDHEFLDFNQNLGLKNFAAIPITSGDKSYIFAVANKVSNYEETDIYSLLLLIGSSCERINTLNIEKALRESEKRYRVLFSNSPDAYLILIDGLIVDCNKACEEMFKSDRSEIIGKSPADISPVYQPDGKKSFDAAHQMINKALKTGNITFEWVHQSSDGNSFYCEISIATTEFNDSNEIFATIRNITKRKLAEQELKRNEKRLEQAQSIGEIGNWEMDISTQMLIGSAQARKIYGINHSRNSSTRLETEQAVLLKFRPLVDEAVSNLIKNKKEFDEEFQIRRLNDNELRWVHAKAELDYDEKGDAVKISGIVQDITERKKAEDAIRESETNLRELIATKDKFFSIIAHDLKSPFNALLNLSGMLLQEYPELTEEEKISFINSIEELSTDTYKLLENLLEWSSIQVGKMAFNPEKLNLLVILYPTIKLFTETAKNKNIQIEYEISKTSEVTADKYMLETILRNLLSNAIKFTNTNGKIIISAILVDSYYEISVKDNGVGIPPKNLEKLFKIEKNVTTKGTANEQGTGLGLLLCKEMVEQNGGNIWGTSQLGEGATFTFSIPSAN